MAKDGPVGVGGLPSSAHSTEHGHLRKTVWERSKGSVTVKSPPAQFKCFQNGLRSFIPPSTALGIARPSHLQDIFAKSWETLVRNS